MQASIKKERKSLSVLNIDTNKNINHFNISDLGNSQRQISTYNQPFHVFGEKRG